jgi:hypothetical protein
MGRIVNPFVFDFPPQNFYQIQLRRIRGKKVEHQPSTFPVFHFCRHRLALMNRRIIQHHDHGIVKALAELFHDIDNHIAIHGSLMLESRELSACRSHETKKIDPFRAGNGNSRSARSSDILPRIRHARIQAQSRFVEIMSK